MIADLARDLRFALRSLWLRPAFALLVVVTLGLGIGANVAIFGLVNAVLLRPLPVAEPRELALFSDGATLGRMVGTGPSSDGRLTLFSLPLYERLRAGMPGLALVAQDANLVPSILRRAGVAGAAGEAAADGRGVSPGFFEVLGVPAHRGRVFGAEDGDAFAATPVLVLSHAFWARQYASDPALIGETLSVNGAAYTVIGVSPPGFRGVNPGDPADFWVLTGMTEPFTRYGSDRRTRDYWWLHLFGRLAPGATLASAQASANASLAAFMAEDPTRAGQAPLRIQLESGAQGFSWQRGELREPLLVLMSGVGLLLLIVCLNVSHLLLARAMARQHEISIRSALGATAGRLLRQLLTEGLVLGLLGAALGMIASLWLSDTLLALATSGNRPFRFELGFTDPRVALFAVLLAIATALLLGVVPMWHASRADLQSAMRDSSRALASGGSRRRVSRLLLVSQVALSLVLLVAAGLLSSSLGQLRAVVMGFDAEHVLLGRLNLPMAGLGEERTRFLYEEIPRRIAALPGVRAASFSRPQVLGGRTQWGFERVGSGEPPRTFSFYLATSGYFDALGLRIVKGRGFAVTDGPDAPRVAVVNEALAARELGGQEAVGQRLRTQSIGLTPARPGMPDDIEIVGVVSDMRTQSVRASAEPVVYLPGAQSAFLRPGLTLSSLEVRSTGDPALLIAQVRQAIGEVQSGLPLLDEHTLSQQVEGTLLQERLLARLATGFGLGALFLVAVGLYGVISQWAGERTREIGVRMALGLSPIGVQWLVLRQAMSLVLIGLGLGIPAALAVAQLLRGLLFGISPLAVAELGWAVLLLVGVGALAAYLPAFRASRLDPVTALRHE